MAEIQLNNTTKAGYYLKLDYSVSAGRFVINSIKGYRTGGYTNWYYVSVISHSISFPGGSGSFSTTKGTGSGPVNNQGVGFKSSGCTWGIQGAPVGFDSSGGTGAISITMNNSVPNASGASRVFTSGNITIDPPTPPVTTPTMTGPTITNVTDTTAHLNIGCSNNGGANMVDYYIDVATGNFSNVVKTIQSYDGDVSGLTPGYTYYVRGNGSNGTHRGYTGVVSFITAFYDPGAPGKPTITYDTPELVPSSRVTITWPAASNGSTPIAGYRVRINKNGVSQNESTMDTNSTSTSLTFNLSDYGFVENDRLVIGIYSYCLRHDGVKMFNGGGTGVAQVFSDTLEVHPERFCKVSESGSNFVKRKVYMSLNGTDFIEVKKGW